MYDDEGNRRNATIDAGACIGGSTSSEFADVRVKPRKLTTIVNGMLWYRPTKAEVDKLETLGNPGWNWENLEPVSKMAPIPLQTLLSI
jgi:hypothetical protein